MARVEYSVCWMGMVVVRWWSMWRRYCHKPSSRRSPNGTPPTPSPTSSTSSGRWTISCAWWVPAKSGRHAASPSSRWTDWSACVMWRMWGTRGQSCARTVGPCGSVWITRAPTRRSRCGSRAREAPYYGTGWWGSWRLRGPSETSTWSSRASQTNQISRS